jgi:tetratricopeptide (TPR) repeat protein
LVRRRLRSLACAAASLCAVGCRGDPRAARPGVEEPLSQAQRRTTAGEIALRNLDAEIETLDRLVTARPQDVAAASALADALQTRAVCLGRIADHLRVARLAEEIVQRAPERGESYLRRARAHAALHRFADARADLREAARRGAPPAAVLGLRAKVLAEIGEEDKALRLLQRMPAGEDDILSLGAAAALHAARGDSAEAQRIYARAVAEYRDVAPYPVAWIYLQQGAAWEVGGRIDRARAFYEASLERLPRYVPALSRLADLEAAAGRPARAVELLRRAIDISDDPDHRARLAALLRSAGRVEEAARLGEQARQHFEALLAEHSEAFAAHAAEFWLDAGGDPERALALARLNWDVRQRKQDRALLARAENAVRAARGPG